jgi:site-specific recombinase XerD
VVLKIGEVESLTIADIHISEKKRSVEVRQGKRCQNRQVPLNKDVREALKAYLAVRPADSGQELFISPMGGGLTSCAIWHMIKKYTGQAGLHNITSLSLRHTFGSRLICKYGVDIVTVAALMGHESIQMMAIYTKPNEQGMIEAVEKLSKQ